MKWFKFYGQDYLSDPKMLSLSSSERSCWITLLCYASVNDNGMITFLSEQQLMLQAGLDFNCDEWDRTVGILEKLKNLQMITNDNGMITVTNWKKRQETSLTPYERVKRYREKKRNDNVYDNVNDNDRIDKIRIDKNKYIPETSVSGTNLEIQESQRPSEVVPCDEFGNPRPVATPKVESGIRSQYKVMVDWAVKRRGGKGFINMPKQYKALMKLRVAGYSPKQIRAAWEEMFHSQKTPIDLDFMSVVNWLEHKK